MTKKEKEQIAETVERMGGEWVAPLAVAHLLKIGQQAAETITQERIAQEVAKQEKAEKEAEARGRVCLMSAEFVGEILKAVYVLANAAENTRYAIIKKYL